MGRFTDFVLRGRFPSWISTGKQPIKKRGVKRFLTDLGETSTRENSFGSDIGDNGILEWGQLMIAVAWCTKVQKLEEQIDDLTADIAQLTEDIATLSKEMARPSFPLIIFFYPLFEPFPC